MRPNHCRGGPCTLARAHIHAVTHMYLPIYTSHTHAYTLHFKTFKRKEKISSCLALSPRWESWEIFQYLILWADDGHLPSHWCCRTFWMGSLCHTIPRGATISWSQRSGAPGARPSTTGPGLTDLPDLPRFHRTNELLLVGRQEVWTWYGVSERELGRAEGRGLSTDTVSNVSDRSFLYRWLERRNNLNRFPKLEPLFHFWETQGFLGFS